VENLAAIAVAVADVELGDNPAALS